MYKFNTNNIENQYPAKKDTVIVSLSCINQPSWFHKHILKGKPDHKDSWKFLPRWMYGWTNNPNSMQTWEVRWQFQEQQGIFRIFSGTLEFWNTKKCYNRFTSEVSLPSSFVVCCKQLELSRIVLWIFSPQYVIPPKKTFYRQTSSRMYYVSRCHI